MADTVTATISKLEMTDRLRRELLANLTHDIRRPITAVQAKFQTYLLRRKDMSDAEQQLFAENVLRSFAGIEHLIDDLFELSKLSAHEVEPVYQPIDLPRLVEDSWEQIRHKAEAREVDLDTEFESPTFLIVSDFRLLGRLLANLLENAVNYTNSGGSVNVALLPDPSGPRLSIRDTGIGIAEADLPQIFERFYRVAANREHEVSGTGLGLAIVKKIAETLKIRLTVESKLGIGTTFSLDFPPLVRRA